MDFLKLDADDINYESILLDLGFDSIGLTTFANAVNDKYKLDVTPVLFFEYPNIREIGKYIASEHPEEAQAVHGGNAPAASVAASQQNAPESVQSLASNSQIVVNKGWNPNQVQANAASVESATGVAGGISPALRFVQQPIAIVLALIHI